MLPPCRKVLHFHLLRSRYVATLWSQASAPNPTANITPEEFGWHLHDGILQPIWYQGQSLPDNLFTNEANFEDIDVGDSDVSDDEGDEAWSEDSDVNDETDP